MAKLIYDIQYDDILQQSSAYRYHLHLFLTESACSYLLLDEHQWLVYKSYALEHQNRALFSLRDELETLFLQDKFLQLEFEEVSVKILNSAFTFVPKALFNEVSLYAYLANVTPSPTSEIVMKETLCDELWNIYVLKIDLKQFLQKTFSNFSLSHAMTDMVHLFEAHAVTRADKTMYINFHQQHIQIAVFDNGKLLFANNYEFQTSSDVAYYVMLVVNQLNLDPEKVNAYLSGHVNKDAELFNTVFRYIRNVQLLESTIQHDAASPFATYPNHTFIDMF